MTEIILPNEWEPKDHQLPLWSYMEQGGLRAVAVWHRRAGKDSTALNWTCMAAHSRIGTYWHMLPEKEQARKAIWLGIDRQGRRIIDQAFPLGVRSKTIDDEMRIDLRCGSVWQVVGSDSYNSLVGANPIGVVISEWSLSNPSAWDYIRPILAENGGWVIFLYTPRGRNHGLKLYEMARKNPDWHAELLTINDTMVISPAVLKAERESGMDDDMIEQEYFCSFEGVRQGSIYGAAMAEMRRQGRIGKLNYDKRFAVNTFWDIGHRDATSIWFHQDAGGVRHHFLRCYESSGESLEHYVAKLKEFGYLYGKHHLPHDAKNVTVASKSNPLGKNVWDQMISLGVSPNDMVLVPRTPDRWTAINATRSQMGNVHMDEVLCADGINALESYHKKWDDARKCYQNDPDHDWSSNFADAFRQWGTGYEPVSVRGNFNFAKVQNVIQQASPQFVRTVGNSRTGY